MSIGKPLHTTMTVNTDIPNEATKAFETPYYTTPSIARWSTRIVQTPTQNFESSDENLETS
jgi:carbamoylphosphate synthase large subunit